MTQATYETIGNFMIQTLNDPEELHDGITVFVKHEGSLVCCDHFGHDMKKAVKYVKRQSKYKITVVGGQFVEK